MNRCKGDARTEFSFATRNNSFVASFQTGGLCQAIRALAGRGIDPGPVARDILRSLRNGFIGSGSGTTVEHIPEITPECCPADLLVIAEVLRVTMLAFLTPEEAHEQRGYFGFRPDGNAIA